VTPIFLVLLLLLSGPLSLVVPISQLFQLLHQHPLIFIMTVINDFINLLLHSLIFFFHPFLHLLHPRVILVDLFHLLESFKIFNLTHQLRERVVGILAEKACAEYLGDLTVIFKQTSIKDFAFAFIDDVSKVINQITLGIDFTAFTINQVTISGFLEHWISERVHFVVTFYLINIELEERE
jgi:hypothetical protein